MAEGATEGGVRSVEVALDILETVAFSGEELGVTQIANRIGITKGSVHRHLLTLVDRGYLEQNPTTSRYGIGAKSRVLARMAPDTDLVQIADGPMRDLRDKLGQTVVLSSVTPNGALVISEIQGSSSIEIGVRPGSELPFHSSAQGKILLAFAPKPFQDRVLSRQLAKLTEHTIVDQRRIQDELDSARASGFVAAPEEAMLGINAIAGPIFDKTDAAIGAVAIVGSIQFLPKTPESTTIAALRECCQQISRRLGYGRSPLIADVPPTRTRLR